MNKLGRSQLMHPNVCQSLPCYNPLSQDHLNGKGLYFRSPSVLSPAPRPPASPQSLILSTLIGYGYIAVFTAILNITTTNRKIAVLESIVMMCITRRKFVFFSVICSVVAGVPKLDEVDKKDRILEKDLSDKKHYEHEEHNVEYDHEAFLGEDAKKFDQLTPEESKRRLALIVDKIDSDSDGSVSQEELKDWIRYTQRRYIQDDVDRQWRTHNPEDKEKISWPEYKKMLYGFMDDLSEADVKEEEGFSYAAMQKRDRRRWAVADQDGDDILDKTEFAAFLHPEETGHMRDVVVLETMEDIDKDKDGKISQQEYIGDMYRSTDGEAEPEWVQNEKEQFSQYRDKDGDGFMDADEVKNWIIPPDFDHAEAEARHLIYESDSDGDSKLTKEEILNKYDIFVGSQATDFGEALARHDEF